jgi:hypothetical protein
VMIVTPLIVGNWVSVLVIPALMRASVNSRGNESVRQKRSVAAPVCGCGAR